MRSLVQRSACVIDLLAPASRRCIAFAAVALVVNLHSLRNLVFIPYVAVYSITAAMVAFLFLKRAVLWGRAVLPVVLWIGVALYGTVVTIVISGPTAAGHGLVRFLFAIPVFMALALWTKTSRDLRMHIISLTTIFAIGSLTLPLQLLIGEVGWFGDASERGGFTRYTSILGGGLTSYGYSVGGYILLALLSPAGLRIPQWLTMISAVFVSLSKAALANAVLAVLGVIWCWRRGTRALLCVFAMASATSLGLLLVPGVRGRLFASLQSFGIKVGDGPTTEDYSFLHSVLSRLGHYPALNFEALGQFDTWLVYLTGGGFGFGNSALVPESASLAPMAHNQFAELLTVFGPVGAVVAVASLCLVGSALLRTPNAEPDLRKAGQVLFTLVLVNAVFANGTFYQPTAACLLYLCFFLAYWWNSPDEVLGPNQLHQDRQPEKSL
jgi:hypothetical protein